MGLILKIFAGIVAGILLGLFAPMPVIKTLSSIGFVLGQYIRFVIPLLIIAFVAKGVAEFGKQAGKALLLGLVLAYVSTICAELLGFSVASAFLPSMGIVPGSVVSAVKITPYLRIEIPAAISIMGALVFAIILGLGITRIQSPTISGFIQEFNGIIGDLIRHGLIPVFPYFVAAVFMDITAKGQLIPTIKAFFMVLLLIIPTQLVWLAVLYTLAEDLRSMQVHTSVAESDIGRLEPGMEATFTVDAFPGRRFKGKLVQIRNAATTVQNVVTYDAVVETANEDLKLRPGMTATVTVIWSQKEKVLAAPNTALRFRPPDEAG
ncbi:MAG TPA: efflux RND transporter periplasmic adaptor subunit, partial [Syntrophales bacterium]|nr:efflux RND transporter periplasmic adaptor subunit [Syntrophales bacterium]